MTDLIDCQECGCHMDNEVTTQFLQFGKQEECFQYCCPSCGLSSPAGGDIEDARCRWNSLMIVIRGDQCE